MISIDKNGEFQITVGGVEVGSGLVILPESDDDFAYVERIDVCEDHRNNGYGSSALRELASLFSDLYIAPDNEDARRLYDRLASEISRSDYDRFGFAIDQGFGVYKF